MQSIPVSSKHQNPRGRHFVYFTYLLLLFSAFLAFSASAHQPLEIRLEIWSNQSFAEPFCSEEPVEIYFRVSEVSYITVYQINPWGGVEIIYPLPHHHWRPVYPRQTYRLDDLAPDIVLRYDGTEGYAYIGIIATPQPVHLVPWLEVGFRGYGLVFGRPERYHDDLDFELIISRVNVDLRLRLGSHCVPAFFIAPIYVRPRIVVSPPPVRVWPPSPPRTQSPPDWRYRDHHRLNDPMPRTNDLPSSLPPESEKPRAFFRRGFESRSPNPPPDYRRRESRPYGAAGRSFPDRSSVKKSGEGNVKKDSIGPARDTSSRASDRRIKKSRN
jgi:hypothetical protein